MSTTAEAADTRTKSNPDEIHHPELVTEAFALVPHDTKKDAEHVLSMVAAGAIAVSELAVTDEATFAKAGEMLKAIKSVSKRLEGVRTTMKAPVLEAGRAIDAFFKTPTTQLSDAETHLKREITTYQAAAEKRRREAEEAARVERERAEAERRAAEEAAAAERAKLSPADREAAEVEDLFGTSSEPSIPAAAEVAPSPPVVVPQLKGVSSRVVVKARVLDVAAVVAAAAAGNPNALALLTVDEKALGGLVKAFGMKLAIPGIETFEDTVVSARAS